MSKMDNQCLLNQEDLDRKCGVLENKDRLNFLRSPSLLGTIAQAVNFMLKSQAFLIVHTLSLGPVDKTKSHALDILIYCIFCRCRIGMRKILTRPLWITLAGAWNIQLWLTYLCTACYYLLVSTCSYTLLKLQIYGHNICNYIWVTS